MKQYILILIVLLILFYFLKFKNKENFINKPKVAILIICANNNRWNIEKDVWKKYADTFSNITCFFIECDNTTEGFETMSLKCNESYIPGIYQKSLNSLKEIGDDYDFYIRGNLSTFYIFEYLNNYLQNIPQNIPVYTGGKIWRNNFVSGTSIVLNKLARNVLIKYGFEKKYYENTIIPDDVLISNVLLDNNIKISKNIKNDNLYFWYYNESYDLNLQTIKKHKYPFLRLKTENIDKYKEITNKLLNEYYSL